MLVMCAASWRSTVYMVEAVRGIVEPVRIATWCKPAARTKVQTSGWAWASVNVVAFRKGRARDLESAPFLDHITAAPVMNGRRAELPMEVARWMVAPFAVAGGLMLDPFAGSGALLKAAEECSMRSIGFELKSTQGLPLPLPPVVRKSAEGQDEELATRGDGQPAWRVALPHGENGS